MRHHSIITVQPMGSCAPWQPASKAMIRLRGKWVANLFPPYTQLRVTLEERNGQAVLVLEPVTDFTNSQDGDDNANAGPALPSTQIQNTVSPTLIGTGDPQK